MGGGRGLRTYIPTKLPAAAHLRSDQPVSTVALSGPRAQRIAQTPRWHPTGPEHLPCNFLVHPGPHLILLHGARPVRTARPGLRGLGGGEAAGRWTCTFQLRHCFLSNRTQETVRGVWRPKGRALGICPKFPRSRAPSTCQAGHPEDRSARTQQHGKGAGPSSFPHL